ncbi:MAG: hypothetical protein ACE37K_01530 [Planctomycetota bacterium]
MTDERHQLATCDERTPPPPGLPITPQRLAQRLRQRRRRTAALAVAALLAVGLTMIGAARWSTCPPGSTATTELDLLERRLEQLLEDLAQPPAQLRGGSHGAFDAGTFDAASFDAGQFDRGPFDPGRHLAFELAYARALALAPTDHPTPTDEIR